jgi:hypothetical protein
MKQEESDYMKNEIKNEFVWEMNEAVWKKFVDALKRGAYKTAQIVGECLSYCRIGDLCFDVRAWNGDEWAGWGFELYCGGVDTGYGYSAKEALKKEEYKDKWDVPDEEKYPYDEVDYGEFPRWMANYPMKEFQEKAEEVFRSLIIRNRHRYLASVDLVEKANEPLHVW